MKFISHRGNIRGRTIDAENNQDHIKNALTLGFDVEVDVWYIDNRLILGHDRPDYIGAEIFLDNPNIWFHAKNMNAFEFLLEKDCNCFWHTDENVVLTSKKNIWVFPGEILIKNSIAVLPERTKYTFEDLKNCYGICSDNIQTYKEMFQ